MHRFGGNQLEQLFERASRLPSRQREPFLDTACGSDGALRKEIESLLRAEERSGDFLSELNVDPIAEDKALRDGVDPGRMIGPYQLQSKLGEGGMSTVYFAFRADDQYRKRVAIKLAPIALVSPEHLRRFRTERHILASLDHPHIAALYDGGTTEDGLPYFVMEYVEGEPIDAYCDRHRLSIPERLELFRIVCSAVHYAHQNLVVHRDLKPNNILVTEAGVPKLLDFGIAMLLNPELSLPDLQPTSTGHRMLTPSYASPEQIQGKAMTTASDVYSLGVLLYRILSGRLPFDREGKTLQEIGETLTVESPTMSSLAIASGNAREVSRARTLEPERLRRSLAGDLDNIASKALKQEPQRRYVSVEQLGEDLRRHLRGLPVLARGDALGYRMAKFLRRHRIAAAIVALFTLVVAGFTILLGVQGARVALERDKARFERDKSQLALRFLEETLAEANLAQDGDQELTAKQIVARAARVLKESKNPPQVEASVMNSLGNISRNLGLYERAEELLRMALEARESKLGPGHQDVGESLNDLSLLCIDQGDFEAAEPLLDRALTIRRQSLGEEHSEVAETINNLGLVQQNQGSYTVAEALFREGLELNRKVFGNEHRYVALSLNNLATALAQVGDSSGAEDAFREAIGIQRRIFLHPHPELAKTLSNLGLILQAMGEFESAESLLREALEVQRSLGGEDHPDVAMVISNLGVLLDNKGDFASAETVLRKAVVLLEESFGKGHLKTAVSRLHLANTLSGKGEYAESAVLYEESLKGFRSALPENHHFLAHPLWGLGKVLTRSGRPRDALPILRDAVRIEQQAWSVDHLHTALAQSILGECLTRLQEFEEAESFLLRSFPVIQEQRGSGHRRTQEALERIVELYEASNQLRKAAEYRDLLRDSSRD